MRRRCPAPPLDVWIVTIRFAFNGALSAGKPPERVDDVLNRLEELEQLRPEYGSALVGGPMAHMAWADERTCTARIEPTADQLVSHRTGKRRQVRWSHRCCTSALPC